MKLYLSALTTLAIVIITSCNNQKTNSTNENKPPATETKEADKTNAATTNNFSATDTSVIAQMETSDFILKVHKAITFELAAKPYQPFKIRPGHKLVVLDISIRNKTTAPYNMGKVLIMTEANDSKGKNQVGQWVVAAYMVDHPDNGHQVEYDALWSDHFGAGEFHRSILLGLDPPEEEKTITLAVPEKADYNAVKKQLKIPIE